MTVSTFEEAQQVFAEKLQGYTRRAHQIALAEQVEEAIEGERHGLFQAGTGTGKSFALLIPAIISGIRTVVATFNKALQNQYIKDLTFLGEHLGIDFEWAILKGRSNYACLAKCEEVRNSGGTTFLQREILTRVDQAVAEGEAAVKVLDREDFPQVKDEDWRPFSMSAAECPGASHCPFGDKCLTEAAKARAAQADIVVTNTAYLMQDLILRQQTAGNVALLGDFGRLIVDEAHTLPDVATGALEDTMGEGTFKALARDMAGYMNREGGEVKLAERVEIAASALWDVLQLRFSEFAEKAHSKDPMPLTITQLMSQDDLGGFFIELSQALWAARDEIKATRAYDDKAKIDRERMLRRSANQLERISRFTTDDPEKTIRWVEEETVTRRGEKRTFLYLRSAPVEVGPFLRTALWDVVPTIMSSATLAAGKDFTYLASTLGLKPGEAMTYDAGSPFDFARQVTLFVPGGNVPSPKKREGLPAWRAYAQGATRILVNAAGGGALLLYTSRSAMNEAYDAMAGDFEAAGLTVLRQGDMPSTEMIRVMKEDGNAVLFALRTFFEGVDIQGHALRLVVLDKLPFAVPSDLVYQARCDLINKRFGDKWASFGRLTIPSMILILVQAFGRLIRHADDVGVVAILDPRLNTERYGRQILNALPPATRTSDIEEATAFLESIRQPVS